MIFKKLRLKSFLFQITFLLTLFTSLFLTACTYKNTDESIDIPVAMSMDENYLFPTIVSITSVMENKKPYTHYSFYIMHPESLSDEAKEKLLSLQNKYSDCLINLIDMADKYNDARTDSWIPTPAYYRLSLSDVLPNLEKIIWLDGDTLTFHDLSELFNIDMNGYYYKGFLDDSVDAMDEFGIYNDHYICSGVMLVNLKQLSEDNMVEQFSKFIRENNDRLKQHDQTVINVVCYENIGILPAKYGIFNYITVQRAQDYVNLLRTPQKYTVNEVKDAAVDPWILHCVSKPWNANANYSKDLWLEYAEKTDFFEEIKVRYY